MAQDDLNPYEVLGVRPDAKQGDIDDAFRKNLVPIREDRNASLNKQEQERNAIARERLIEANRILSSPINRKRYDAQQSAVKAREEQRSGAPTEYRGTPSQTGSTSASKEIGGTATQKEPSSSQVQKQQASMGKRLALERAKSARRAIFRSLSTSAEPIEPEKSKFRLAKILALVSYIISILVTPFFVTFVAILVWIVIEIIVFDIAIAMLVRSQRNEHNVAVIEDSIQNINGIRAQTIALRRSYASTLKFLRTTRFRAPVSRIALRFAQVRSVLTRRVMGRLGRRMLYGKLPILEWYPWRYMGVRTIERDAIETYHLAIQAREEEQEVIQRHIALQTAISSAQEEESYQDAT